MKLIISILLLMATITTGLVYLTRTQQQREFGASVVDTLSNEDNASGFARADRVREFVFPDDAGPHPQFQTEWWYYTGNLTDESGRHFGFQLTFFRRALSPDGNKRLSKWATNQVYFAHFAVSDVKNRAFYPSERWSRGAMGLAGAEGNPYRVWVEGWSATAEGKSVRLRAKNDSAEIDLILTPKKPIVLHGDNGLSKKSAEPGNASYYFSETRLHTRGTITVKGETFEVAGFSWLDREWSTSALSQEQAGWDWFSLQLSDNREVMLYQIRLKNGGIDPYSSGSLIESEGVVYHLDVDDFKIEVLDTWKSPNSSTIYPSKWRIKIPRHNIDLTVTPHQPNQELSLTFTYWEGAVKVEGEDISGNGYVELTGYANPKQADSVSNNKEKIK
jgi:predicted secreted hydrolase